MLFRRDQPVAGVSSPLVEYAPSPTKALNWHSIVQGHVYSLLTWTPEPDWSWSPTVFSQRLQPEQSAIEVEMVQVKQLGQARPAGVRAR